MVLERTPMAIASPHRAFRWNSPWLIAIVVFAVAVAGTFGIGLATGLFRPGGQSVPPVATTPSTTSTITPSPLTSPSPSSSPTVTPTPASVVAELRGKIAISNGRSGSGGWITFPGGTFTPDPGSNVTLPVGGGSIGLTHILALNKWVPVPRDWVSPDGTKYAYFLFDGYRIHVVRAGNSELLLSPPILGAAVGGYWSILATENTGLYLVYAIGFTPMPGLWWVAYSGAARQVTNAGYWTATDGRFAYGDLSTSVPQGGANSIVRLDLSTGQSVPVFTRDGMHSKATGVDRDGNPVILAVKPNERPTYPSLFQIWVATSTSPVKLYEAEAFIPVSPPEGWVPFAVFSVVPDSMGTWISTSKALYLYSHAAGFEFASPVTGPLASAFRR